ncbi:MAG: Winged helix-turn-helix DNA-binding [Thermoplasmata archaeon]|jgi:predicted transcriptional regulator|nr:Winged helix-turn-helix DNA-binding [Thermoplasmata archaeon]
MIRALAVLLLLLAPALLPATSLGSAAEPLRVGVPRQGDHFAYVENGRTTTLVWNGTLAFWDEWGRPMRLDMLEIHDDQAPVRVGYRGGEPVPRIWEAYGGRASGGGGSTGDAFLWGDNTTTMKAETGGIWYAPSTPAGRACLERAGWQGMALDAIARADAGALCPAFEGEAIRENGTEIVRGYAATRFELLRAGDPAGAVWLAPGLPYALAWSDCRASPLGGDPCGDAGNATVRLVGFEAGQDPLLPAQAPLAPGTVDPSDFVEPAQPAPDHGFSPFPAEAALAAIANDTSLTQHRDFMASHPDAPIVWATHAHDPHKNDSTAESWTFVWASREGGSSSVTSTQDGSCTVPDLPPPATLPRSAMMCKPAQREGQASVPPGTVPRQPPARSLSFAAAVRRFQAERLNPDEPLWTYSYQIGADGATIEVDAALTTPSAQPAAPLQQPANNGGEGNGDGIVLDALTGKAIMRQFVSSVDVTWTRTPGLLPPLSGQAAADGTKGHAIRLGALQTPGPAAVPGFTSGSAKAATLAVAGASLLALLLLSRAALAVLYSRIRSRELPAHPRRAIILRALETTPGLSVAELSDATGIRGGAVRHHLRVLVRGGHLARAEAAGQARYFLAGSLDPVRLAERAVLLADGAEARVLLLLRRSPGAHAAALARELGVSRPAVHYVVKRLARRGLVESRTEGGQARLYPRV